MQRSTFTLQLPCLGATGVQNTGPVQSGANDVGDSAEKNKPFCGLLVRSAQSHACDTTRQICARFGHFISLRARHNSFSARCHNPADR